MDSKTTVKQEESIYLISNPYVRTIDKSRPSKTRLKKCEKGLHEYLKTGNQVKNIPTYACIYCGKVMNNH